MEKQCQDFFVDYNSLACPERHGRCGSGMGAAWYKSCKRSFGMGFASGTIGMSIASSMFRLRL